MIKNISESSFIQWYPRGRLGLIPLKHARFLKEYRQLLESAVKCLTHLHFRKSQLSQIFDRWNTTELTSGDTGYKSEFPTVGFNRSALESPIVSPEPSCADRILKQIEKLKFSHDPLLGDVLKNPCFTEMRSEWPQLLDDSDFPALAFDRALYALDCGAGKQFRLVESNFPPVQCGTSVLTSQHLVGQAVVTEDNNTFVVLEIEGTCHAVPVSSAKPFCSRICEEDQKKIHDFYKNKIGHLVRFLASQTAFVNVFVDRFTYTLESAAYLVVTAALPPFFIPPVAAS